MKRPPSSLWYNVDDFSKVVIRDLAHDENQIPTNTNHKKLTIP